MEFEWRIFCLCCIEVTAIADINVEGAKGRAKEMGLDPDKISFYNDADQMLENEELSGVFIGTRCSLHAAMAVKVLKRNIPLFLEKPIATNMEDLIKLRDAASVSKSPVVVSFPLRVTAHAEIAKQIIDSGQIGTIENAQAWNNVPYGAVYFQQWYRDECETGGLFLQKATHDFDYLNYPIAQKPVKIAAMLSKQIYKGNTLLA
jgi:predicted dehydrogenase